MNDRVLSELDKNRKIKPKPPKIIYIYNFDHYMVHFFKPDFNYIFFIDSILKLYNWIFVSYHDFRTNSRTIQDSPILQGSCLLFFFLPYYNLKLIKSYVLLITSCKCRQHCDLTHPSIQGNSWFEDPLYYGKTSRCLKYIALSGTRTHDLQIRRPCGCLLPNQLIKIYWLN